MSFKNEKLYVVVVVFGVEAVFQDVIGVEKVVLDILEALSKSTYEQVSSGRTKHAEV